ncbi:hypothetical protein DWV52_14150 [Ruminococcaceae bacterium AF10-16]|nr:hypothetical protein DWV52_14150 [Ruminococcaceae bacterium AF10-16]
MTSKLWVRWSRSISAQVLLSVLSIDASTLLLSVSTRAIALRLAIVYHQK